MDAPNQILIWKENGCCFRPVVLAGATSSSLSPSVLDTLAILGMIICDDESIRYASVECERTKIRPEPVVGTVLGGINKQ